MPKKIRVYELAHELGLTNKEALDLCLSLGMGVKSHSSSIEDAQADRARRKADREGLRRPVQPEEPAPDEEGGREEGAREEGGRAIDRRRASRASHRCRVAAPRACGQGSRGERTGRGARHPGARSGPQTGPRLVTSRPASEQPTMPAPPPRTPSAPPRTPSPPPPPSAPPRARFVPTRPDPWPTGSSSCRRRPLRPRRRAAPRAAPPGPGGGAPPPSAPPASADVQRRAGRSRLRREALRARSPASPSHHPRVPVGAARHPLRDRGAGPRAATARVPVPGAAVPHPGPAGEVTAVEVARAAVMPAAPAAPGGPGAGRTGWSRWTGGRPRPAQPAPTPSAPSKPRRARAHPAHRLHPLDRTGPRHRGDHRARVRPRATSGRSSTAQPAT